MAPAPSPFSCPPGARPTESVRKLVLSPHPVSVIPRYPFPPPGRRRPAPPDTESPFIFAAARQPGPHRLLSRFRPNRRRIRIPADPRANFQSRDANLTESDPRGVICFRRRADPALPRPAQARPALPRPVASRGPGSLIGVGQCGQGRGSPGGGQCRPVPPPWRKAEPEKYRRHRCHTVKVVIFPAAALLCSCSAPPGAGPTPLASPRGPE